MKEKTLKVIGNDFYKPFVNFFFHGSTVLVGLGLLMVKVSRTHSETPHSVGLLFTTDRPVAETST
jgi:hypothetical protein